jgi:hypothetical protein
MNQSWSPRVGAAVEGTDDREGAAPGKQALHQPAETRRVVGQGYVGKGRSAHFAYVLHQSDAEIGVGPAAQECELLAQFLRQPDIVGIEERDELAAGEADSGVARRRQTGLGLTMDAHTVEDLGQLGGTIRRAVVDNHDLDCRAVLGINP